MGSEEPMIGDLWCDNGLVGDKQMEAMLAIIVNIKPDEYMVKHFPLDDFSSKPEFLLICVIYAKNNGRFSEVVPHTLPYFMKHFTLVQRLER